MKLKLKMSMKIFAAINRCLTLVIIWLCQNTMVVQAILSLEKWIGQFVGLKPNMYLFLVDNNSEHKKAKHVNRNMCCCNNKS